MLLVFEDVTVLSSSLLSVEAIGCLPSCKVVIA